MQRLALATLVATLAFVSPALATTGVGTLTVTPAVQSLATGWTVNGNAAEVAKWTVKWRPVTSPLSKWNAGVTVPAAALSYTIPSLEVRAYQVNVKATLTNGKAGSAKSAFGTPLAKEEEEHKEETAGAGAVKYRLDAASYFDSYANESTWIKAHISRVLGYFPFGAKYVPDAPTLGYRDAYTSFGANALNPAHRAEYVKWTESDKREGAAGAFMDDLEWAKASGQHIPGTEEETALLVEAVRTALGPTGILELNTQPVDLWARMKESDPFVARALAVTNQVDIEFGVTQITTASAYAELFAYVDALHAKAVHVDLVSAKPGNEWSLASYLLLNDGGDFIGAHITPPEQWAGFSANLGNATSPREHSGAVWKRTFVGGVAYTVDPGASSQTIPLGKTMHRLNGEAATSITLSGAQGAVLLP